MKGVNPAEAEAMKIPFCDMYKSEQQDTKVIMKTVLKTAVLGNSPSSGFI